MPYNKTYHNHKKKDVRRDVVNLGLRSFGGRHKVCGRRRWLRRRWLHLFRFGILRSADHKVRRDSMRPVTSAGRGKGDYDPCVVKSRDVGGAKVSR